MANYFYDTLSLEAQHAITREEYEETIERVRETLKYYSDGEYIDFEVEHIEKNIVKWAENKHNKIMMFKAHENYDPTEPWKIYKDIELERKVDVVAVCQFANLYYCKGELANIIYDTILNFKERFISEENVRRFNSTRDSEILFCVDAERIEKAKKVNPHVGQKTSKFVRNLIVTLGYELNEAEYAKYADAINPTTFNTRMFISIDPVDFLLMSHGNGWTSCYTINAHRSGQNYGGCYSAGTWSYMNDESTMLMYRIDDKVNDDFAEAEKIEREVVLFNDVDTIACSRIYPQGSTSTSKEAMSVIWRQYAQKFVSEIFKLNNYWTTSHGYNTEVFKQSPYFTGYNDFYNFSQLASYSRLKENANKPHKMMYFGNTAYCPVCGDRTYERYLCSACDDADKYTCASCGNRYDEDDIEWIDGDTYCHSCCTYCEYHEEYEADDNTDFVSVNGGWGTVMMCSEGIEKAIEDNDVFYCDDCDEYYYASHYDYYLTNDGKCICESCYNDNYCHCTECGECFSTDEATYDEDACEWYCDNCYADTHDEE